MTSNLRSLALIGGPAVSAIEIYADEVTLDLGGFEVRCERASLPTQPCTNLAVSVSGIVGFGQYATIRDGAVRDFPGRGVTATGVIENIRARNNGDAGIQAGEGSIVRGCTVRINAGDEIKAGLGSLVQDNVVTYNTGAAAALGQGAGFGGNVFFGNGNDNVTSGLDLGGNVCGFSLCP